MPKRSKIATLPAEVRNWLRKTLIDGNFAGYEALAAELKRLGYDIGKSSIHRYGAGLERQLALMKATTEAAVMLHEAAPDDADTRSGAVIGMIQSEIFDVMMKIGEARDADPAERMKLFSSAAKNIATLTRASVGLKKWQVEVRDKVKAAADRVAKLGQKGGLTKDAVDSIRREILGIAA